jgi:hypothetical protein
VPERCCTKIGSGLTRKHSTRLAKLAIDKHSNLLPAFVDYGGKKFNNIAPGANVIITHRRRGQCYETFFVRKLRIFILSQSVSWAGLEEAFQLQTL